MTVKGQTGAVNGLMGLSMEYIPSMRVWEVGGCRASCAAPRKLEQNLRYDARQTSAPTASAPYSLTSVASSPPQTGRIFDLQETFPTDLFIVPAAIAPLDVIDVSGAHRAVGREGTKLSVKPL